ncbi:hypothetical protein LGT39_01125 [Demequina sp. TTPB684]|uniref:hypothetical protein n=1 Tax=unclassified Demequina TaxID=2620311 RepID=UPI001CF3598A|nr:MULTISPECIES: hypothetical protein [unclassified Demequina]MCB2411448.1 hypothetical protein [Demequina sp. TTPB684]UPU88824.1 hypothetical protein LGT36_002585 [Demequina sp. TMPB413]
MITESAVPLLLPPEATFSKPPWWRHWLVPVVGYVGLAVLVAMAWQDSFRYVIIASLIPGGFLASRILWVSGALGSGKISLLDGRVREGSLQLAGLGSVFVPRRWVTFDGGGTLTVRRVGDTATGAYKVSDGRASTSFRTSVDWDEINATALIEAARGHGYTVRFEE